MSRIRRASRSSRNGGHDSAGGMRWLLTYADLITLLMVFFVVLYAMSSVEQKKFEALKGSLQAALNAAGGSSAVLPYDGEKMIPMAKTEDSLNDADALKEMMQQIQQNAKNPNQVSFQMDERGLTIRFLDNILFDSGRAELRPESSPMLDAVVKAVKTSSNYVRVEGHADNLPIHTVQFPSNWELSSARSIAVTRYFIQHQVDPRRLSSLGYGEYRPLYANDSEEHRAKNRRVDIIILRTEKSGAEEIR